MPYRDKEKDRAYKKQYYLDHIEERKEYSRNYDLKNKEKIALKNSKWYLKNKEYRKKYKQERIEKTRIWENHRYKTNINFRLTKILRTRTRQALKGIDKSDLTLELIGCTIDELKKHLESQFEQWMSLANQGR